MVVGANRNNRKTQRKNKGKNSCNITKIVSQKFCVDLRRSHMKRIENI